jgi:tetratricopeptide (TPR) repeat protein
MEKLLISLFLLVSFPCFSFEVDKDDALFMRGTNMLKQGKHVDAAKVLETLGRKGVGTAELYCNLGNAYFESGQLGKAVVSYEKAFILSPFDAQINYNRKAVLEATPNINNADEKFTNDHLIFRAGEISARIGAFLLFISALFYVLRALKYIEWYNAKVQAIYKLCLISACLLLASATILMVLSEAKSDAIVVVNAIGRSGPSHNAEDLISLTEGEKILTKRFYKGWYKVKTLHGSEAWIESSSLEKYK